MVFFCLPSGIFIDYFGVNRILIPSAAIVAFGMLIQTFAAFKNSFVMLLFGRLIFAIGCELINITKGLIVSDWFMGTELSTANALNLSYVRSVVFLSGALTPAFERNQTYTMSFAAGFIVCILTLISTFILSSY